MKKAIFILLGSLILIHCTVTIAPAKVSKWRLQAFMPPADDLYSKYIAVNLVEKIKAATNGEIEITPYSGGALVPPPEIFKSVVNGIVQMGYTATGYHIGFMPIAAVADGLPMSFRNYEDQLTCFRERGLGNLFAVEYKKNGVHLLTVHCTEPYTVLSSKPLNSQLAWRGAKIRGWGIWNRYFAKLGASAVDMPLKDVYMALTMKTIDGCVTGVNPHWQLKHFEVCKYGLWPPLLGSALHDVYVNLGAWNELTPKLQEAMIKASREWTNDTAKAWAKFSNDNKENLTSKGVKWTDVDDRDWLTTKAMELWQEAAAKDGPSAKAVQIMTDYLREVGAIRKK